MTEVTRTIPIEALACALSNARRAKKPIVLFGRRLQNAFSMELSIDTTLGLGGLPSSSFSSKKECHQLCAIIGRPTVSGKWRRME